MIDRDVFATGMGLLAGNFNKNLDAAVSRAYYNALSTMLDTEQFGRAVALTLAEETFWPTIAGLAQKVAPRPTEAGYAALEFVNRVVGDAGGYRYFPHERFAEFDAPTKAAIAAVGGLAEIGECSVEHHPAMARRFAAAYAKAVQPRLLITLPPTDPKVQTLVTSLSAQLPNPNNITRKR